MTVTVQMTFRQPSNKRLKLAGPAFRGTGGLCANELVPQGEVLAPAGARPAA